MDNLELIKKIATPSPSKIVLLVIDGLAFDLFHHRTIVALNAANIIVDTVYLLLRFLGSVRPVNAFINCRIQIGGDCGAR